MSTSKEHRAADIVSVVVAVAVQRQYVPPAKVTEYHTMTVVRRRERFRLLFPRPLNTPA